MRRNSRFFSPVASLECRRLPSGSVSLSFDGDTLQLIGDNSANQIRISRSLEGLQIQAESGTRLNGVINGTHTTVSPSSIVVDLRGGNDLLTLSGHLGGQVSIQMGSGNDAVQGNSVICTQVFSIDLGSGNDRSLFQGTAVAPNSFGANVTWNGNTGNDVMKFEKSIIQGNLTAVGGSGNDSFGGVHQVVYGAASVDLGSGNDLLGLFNWECRSTTTILGATGDDVAAMHDSQFLSTVTVNLGDGKDGLLNYQNQFNSGVTRDGGTGNDLLFRSGNIVVGTESITSFESQFTTLTSPVNALYTRLNSVFSL